MACVTKECAQLFKALADETRLTILEIISCGELCACEILLSLTISQSSLSYHMKILCDNGLVNCRIDGKRSMYSLDEKGFLKATDCIKALMVETKGSEKG